MSLSGSLQPFLDLHFVDESDRHSIRVESRTSPLGVGYVEYTRRERTTTICVVSRKPGQADYSLQRDIGFEPMAKDDLISAVVSILGLKKVRGFRSTRTRQSVGPKRKVAVKARSLFDSP
jgi:hypothetical protein